MTLKLTTLAIGAAILAAPLASHAQQYEGRYQDQSPSYQYGYGQRGYDRYEDRSRGDYYRQRPTYSSYPQFRGLEQHIRSEIQSGLRDDLIAPDDARDLLNQLRQIQYQEAREYRVHGWNLPRDDDQRIRQQLNELDRTVDETRQEP